MTVLRRPCCTAVVAALVTLVSAAHAVEVRHVQGSRYSVDVARAYEQCVAPNTTSSTGIPACAPAVTSVCTYTSGAIEIHKREDTREIEVDVDLNNVSGPGSCTTGPFLLKLGLRVSVDDAACATGACTVIDFETSIPLVLVGNDFELNGFTLESALPGPPPPIANYELLHAYILAPDGNPIAGAGTEDDNSADVHTDLGTAYAACAVPDTSNAWSAPACSGTVWQSPCDFSLMDVDFNRTGAGPRLRPRAFGLTGLPAACADGTYVFIPRVRITTDDCGVLCTLVDLDLPLHATAVDGEINLGTVPLISDPTAVGVGFLDDDDDLELLGLTVLDPLGNLLAGSAVTPTLRIDGARVRAGYRDTGNPSDDVLTVKGDFPHPPVDPTIAGATFTLTGKSGTAFTATLPAGSWIVRKPGRHWFYKDDLGSVSGVRRAEIREFRSSGIPTGFKVRVAAKDTSAGAADQPALNLVVSVSGGAGTQVATRGTICKQSTKRLSCK